jgi:hypothetical protein
MVLVSVNDPRRRCILHSYQKPRIRVRVAVVETAESGYLANLFVFRGLKTGEVSTCGVWPNPLALMVTNGCVYFAIGTVGTL